MEIALIKELLKGWMDMFMGRGDNYTALRLLGARSHDTEEECKHLKCYSKDVGV